VRPVGILEPPSLLVRTEVVESEEELARRLSAEWVKVDRVLE